MWGPEEDWPKRPSGMGNVEDINPEVKRSARSFATEAKEATTEDCRVAAPLQNESEDSKN